MHENHVKAERLRVATALLYSALHCAVRVSPQVKLLKCLVDDIVVDISFNQFGGLCTLNFLEEVDVKIGRKNLFKRSIILVSAGSAKGGGVTHRLT